MSAETPKPATRRTRLPRWAKRTLWIALGVVVLMAIIHFTINGIPGLEFINPHARH